eukprot:1640154-Amphidinium_carterae.1
MDTYKTLQNKVTRHFGCSLLWALAGFVFFETARYDVPKTATACCFTPTDKSAHFCCRALPDSSKTAHFSGLTSTTSVFRFAYKMFAIVKCTSRNNGAGVHSE